MTGLPTFLVELDDGTGTFPDDITTAVSLKAGGSITRGRADEHGSITPTVLRLGIEWSGLSGITTFNDQMIRVTETVGATTSVRFTGYVQDWPVEWPSGGDEYAITRITAVDRLARLARRKLKSMIEHEYLVDAPLLFYPLTEREDSESAGDVSGNGGPSLIPDGAGVVFGATSLDGQGAVTLPAGVSLRSAPGATGISAEASASFWVECFCDFGSPQTNIVSVEFASGATVTLRTDGAGALEA
ncbi:MAG TPA: hypothetical protein VJ782_09275, partial [Aeromicrobium sp.]|nr:hypothetical protein [Aeromicrobium sp.]